LSRRLAERMLSRVGSRTALRAATLVGGLLVLVLPCCRPAPKGRLSVGSGVLVIAVDALRADRLGCYGCERETTPVIDSWAAQGSAFLQTFSPSPEMQGAHAALLTGSEPLLSHRELERSDDPVARLSEWSVPESLPHLAREYLAAGYTTAAFVDHFGLSNVYGYNSGFQEFQCFAPDASESSVGYEAVAKKLFDWLRDRALEEDWFAYVHVNDLERLWEKGGSEPFFDNFFEARPGLEQIPPVAQAERSFFSIARPRWRNATRSLGEYEALYDGALRRLDTKFGQLFEELRKRGRLRNTTVVIVGTYGVGFGEAGLLLDSGTLSDVDLHVPLIIRPAPVLNCRKGVRSTDLVSLCDLAPTLLDLARPPLRKPPGMSGVSLAPILNGTGPGTRGLAFAKGGVHGGFAVFDKSWCFESIQPAAGGSQELLRSWTGEDGVAAPRRHLHDRSKPDDLGHLGAGVDDAPRAAGMERAGIEWYADVELARDVLRGKKRASELAPAQLAHLREEGLLGESP
jgi:arylsulfatase A-like enzyme